MCVRIALSEGCSTKRDAATGKKVFESQCVLCHGQSGGGGRGPSLSRPKLNRAPDDPALQRIISDGVEPEMPGAWQLNPREVESVAVYVRSLGALPPEDLPGDPDAAWLRRTVLQPADSLPDSFLYLAAIPASGEPVRAIRVNEDSFTIQLKDARGNFPSFRKAGLQELRRLEKETPMPSYQGRIAPSELDDLIAYLADLKGKP